MKYFLLLFAMIFFASCGNTADTIVDETLDGEYELRGVGGKSFNAEEAILITFNPIGNTVNGTTGCNRFSANYRQEGRQVSFTTPISTRKFCEGKMRTERQLLSSLEEAAKFTRNGNSFQFFSSDNDPLITLTKTEYSE